MPHLMQLLFEKCFISKDQLKNRLISPAFHLTYNHTQKIEPVLSHVFLVEPHLSGDGSATGGAIISRTCGSQHLPRPIDPLDSSTNVNVVHETGPRSTSTGAWQMLCNVWQVPRDDLAPCGHGVLKLKLLRDIFQIQVNDKFGSTGRRRRWRYRLGGSIDAHAPRPSAHTVS